MSHTAKDRLAAEVEERCLEFEDALSDKRKYPIRQFRAFWQAGVRYAEQVKHDPLLHRSVVRAVNGLLDFLSVERKRVPGEVLRDAERLECILFSGYDPYPPGLQAPYFPRSTYHSLTLRAANARGGHSPSS